MLTITGSLWLCMALILIIIAALCLLIYGSFGERATRDRYPHEKLREPTLEPQYYKDNKNLSSLYDGVLFQASSNKPSLKQYPARRIVVDESRVQSVFIATEEEVKKLMKDHVYDPSLEETTAFCAPEGAYQDDDDVPSNPMEHAYNRYCDSERYMENQHRSFTEGWKACTLYLRLKGENNGNA